MGLTKDPLKIEANLIIHDMSGLALLGNLSINYVICEEEYVFLSNFDMIEILFCYICSILEA